MQLRKLDHVNVRTSNLEAMIAWYSDILGMRSGDRPNFAFPGAWMYVGDEPVVHLVGVEGTAGAGSEGDLKLEHFALSATGISEFEARLKAADETYQRRDVPGFGITQFNIWDPDGNHIHIDFASGEAA
ncbi:MAG: VOC family protein [Hyphomicrobiaceae bacterium]